MDWNRLMGMVYFYHDNNRSVHALQIPCMIVGVDDLLRVPRYMCSGRNRHLTVDCSGSEVTMLKMLIFHRNCQSLDRVFVHKIYRNWNSTVKQYRLFEYSSPENTTKTPTAMLTTKTL